MNGNGIVERYPLEICLVLAATTDKCGVGRWEGDTPKTGYLNLERGSPLLRL